MRCLAAMLLAAGLAAAGCGKDEPAARPERVDPAAAALLAQARQAFDQGAYPWALVLADSAAGVSPRVAEVHFTRGRILTALGLEGAAQGAYRQALTLDPDHQVARFNLANAAFRQGQYRDALALYTEIRRAMYGQNVQLYAGETGAEGEYAVLRQIGRAYAQLGVADSARLAYEQAVALAPEEAPAYSDLSQLLESTGALEEALLQARRALERNPAHPDYRYSVGSLLVRTGRAAEAVPYLEQARAERPWHHGAHYNLAQALSRLGREAEAARLFARADSLQKLQARLDDLQEVAEKSPEDPRPWLEYGDALRGAGRMEDAYRAYSVAASLLPGNLHLQNNLAILAESVGDTLGAVRRYQAILQQDSTLADVWLNLGAVYADMGEVAAARKAWEAVLRQQPGHPEARAYLARLPAE